MSSRQKKSTQMILHRYTRSGVPRALQSFPAASITDSLKETFLSFISFSWLKLFQLQQTSSLCFAVLRQPPGTGACQKDLGKADYWGPGLRQVQNINSVREHLSLQFICFIVFPQDFTTVTQRHKFSTMTTHTHTHFFPTHCHGCGSQHLLLWLVVPGGNTV